jgi:hypothetical protein
MTEASPKLSTTARNVLTLAAARDDHMVRVPQLPVAAARQVIRSLLNAGLVEEIAATVEDADFAWRTGDDGDALVLRATEVGLARVRDSAAGEVLSLTDDGRKADETLASAEPGSVVLTIASQRTESATGPLPASVADALDLNVGELNEDAPGVAIQIDAGIAPLINAFVRELMKQERAPFVAAFLRRMERGTTERGTEGTGTKRAREMSGSQRKIIELCSRPEGATGKELAEGCGWPSIAARATCQKIADRFGYVLNETPKSNGRGITFRMTAKPAMEV